MIAGLLVLQALALGLEGEAPCTDVPPSAWSVGELPGLSGVSYCLDLVVLPDGELVVASGNSVAILADGQAWASYTLEGGGCLRLSADGGVVRALSATSDGTVVLTRGFDGWSALTLPGSSGLSTLLPDGQVRTIEADAFGDALVVHDSGAETDELIPIPGTSIGGNSLSLRAIAVGPAGSTHVLFQRNGRSALEYATNVSGAWSFEIAERLELDRVQNPWAPPDLRPSLAVDAAGAAHVAFRLRPSMKLAYATNRSGSWVRTIVDHGAPTGLPAILRLAPDGTPWIAYQRTAAGDLKLAALGSDGWRSLTVDAEDTAGGAIAFASDPDGGWHLVYTRFGYDARPAYGARPLQYAVPVPCQAAAPAPLSARRRP